MSVDYRPEYDPADVDSDYGHTGGDITVPTFTANMKPFRFWCQKALPLVYDDSLSYYEVLCKVVKQMNDFLTDLQTATGAIDQFAQQFVINQQFLNDMADQLGQNVQDLEDYINDRLEDYMTAYTQLQNYVNNYFDNLDVQQEINNKLDEMAEDGTFNTLFDPVITAWMTAKTAQIDAAIANQDAIQAQQNGRISVLEGRMDTFSGLPSGSTSGNAELLDIRTNFLGETYPTAGDAVRASDMIASGFLSIPFTRLEEWNGNESSNNYDTIQFDVSAYKGGHVVMIANMDDFILTAESIGVGVFATNVSGKTADQNAHAYALTSTVFPYYSVIPTQIAGEERIALFFSIPEDFNYQYLKMGYVQEIPNGDYTQPAAIVYANSWSKTQVDPTLSIAGAAADAKATGDALDELNERLDKDEGATYADSVSIDKINFTLSDAIRNNYWFRIDLEADAKYQIKNLSDATIAIAASDTTSLDASDVTINNGLSPNNTIQFTLNASKKYLRIFFGVTQGSTGTVNVELSRTDSLRPRIDTLESDVSSTQNAIGMFVSLNVNDYVVAFDGHYINANTGEVASITSNNWGVSDYIQVFPSGKVAVYATDGTNVVQETGAYYDTNKQLISGMGKNTTGAEKTFDVPSNCYYIRLSLNKLGISQTTVKVQNTVDQVAHQSQIDNIMDILESINPGSKWNDKDCVQIGDSITWYDGHVNTAGETVKGYAYYLRQIFHSVDNQGVSGASIALHSGGVTDVCETVDTIDFGDYAFVTIAGGINDCQYQDSPMGAYTTGTTYDRTTFYGAYQYILDKIYTDNPTIQILIFTPMKSRATDNGWQNQEGNTLLDYVDAVLDIAKKYSIPVLNLYDISGINKYTYNSYTLDGLHPNNAGYAEISGMLISAVNSL